MAVNDLSRKDQIVLNFMRELAKQEFPNLDLSEHGAFMEMFGTPHVKLLTPLLDYADRIKLTQSLDNAELMTEEEMDEYAEGHFFYRKSGEYSTGYATMAFDDIPANGVIQIPAGTEAESKQGFRFRTVESVILNEEELANYYDTDLFQYRIPVFFEAENQGSQYDIKEGELSNLITPLPHFSDLVNDIAFRGGKDKESNLELANRIRETAETPNVGVERGWIGFAKSFDEVEDVIVAGYGHPLMKRDIVGIAPEGRFVNQVSREVHWGGKVDLHIRGKRLGEQLETHQLARNSEGELYVTLSKHPTYDISEIIFTSPRYTDPDLDPSFFVVRDFLMMKNEDPETIGTLNEESWVIIKDERLDEFDSITVRYRYNQLIQAIETSLYTEDNRPPASDVLLKEARKKVIHSSMILKLEGMVGMQEKDRSVIRQRLYNYITQMPMGAEFQSSDLGAPIYQYDEASIDTRVDYISNPSQFIVTDYDNKYLYYCLNEEKRAFLDELRQSSVYFAQWLPYYMDNVTIYDFFDVMHVLTYQNVEKDAWKNLSYTNNAWGKKVYFVNTAKRMLAFVSAIQRLSLPKWQSQQNDYFDLGHSAIFDDVTYVKKDLESYVNLFETIANPGESEINDENLLHLTIYCSVILYVITAENVGGMTVKDLYEWLTDLTKGTPVDYQVHH